MRLKDRAFERNISMADYDDTKYVAAKIEKRAWEGKETEFSYRGSHILASEIQNFKRRRPRDEC